MKKGWQKRLGKFFLSWKTDWTLDFGEFMLQSASLWFFAVLIYWLVSHFFLKDSFRDNLWYILSLYLAGIIGAMIGYWLRHRKKK
jgi:hypothetical protein